MSAVALALAGALLLWLPGFQLGIERQTCAAWPSAAHTWYDAVAYAAAVALLSMAWLRALKHEWSLGRALGFGALVHLVALGAPPFASFDPLFYAAIGRTLAHGGTANTPVATVLGLHDSLVELMPPHWRLGTSPYGAAFDQLVRGVALLTHGSLVGQLRVYQLVNACVLVATAAVTGRAFGANAAAAVLFSPIAIIDGTVNPHNDAWLALASALFALGFVRGRPGAGLLALVAALAVKLSAAILLAWDLLRLALRPVASRLRVATLLWGGALVAVGLVVAVIVGLQLWPDLHRFTALVGEPADPHPKITRSLELLPRAVLFYALHYNRAAWAVGLFFRAAAALWLVYCAFRGATAARPLMWLATALFGYYLGLHAFMQTWYLLPLLPLASELPDALQPAWRAFTIGLVAYYAPHLIVQCSESVVVVVLKELSEALIVLLPPTIRLLQARRQVRARASA